MQSMVLIEVQDTLAQHPSEVESMKKATGFSIAITVSFQLRFFCLLTSFTMNRGMYAGNRQINIP